MCPGVGRTETWFDPCGETDGPVDPPDGPRRLRCWGAELCVGPLLCGPPCTGRQFRLPSRPDWRDGAGALLARGGRLREPHGVGADPTLTLFIDESSRALACPCLAVVDGTGATADFCPISAGFTPAR